MINGLLSCGLMDEAVNLFREMEESGCPPDNCTYNIMIRGFIVNHELSRGVEYANEMVARGFSADASTAKLFLHLISNGELDSSLQLLIQKDS